VDLSKLDFKRFVLAVIIVSTGIYIVNQSSSEAAWLLTFIILLGAAFANPNFSDELKAMIA